MKYLITDDKNVSPIEYILLNEFEMYWTGACGNID